MTFKSGLETPGLGLEQGGKMASAECQSGKLGVGLIHSAADLTGGDSIDIGHMTAAPLTSPDPAQRLGGEEISESPNVAWTSAVADVVLSRKPHTVEAVLLTIASAYRSDDLRWSDEIIRKTLVQAAQIQEILRTNGDIGNEGITDLLKAKGIPKGDTQRYNSLVAALRKRILKEAVDPSVRTPVVERPGKGPSDNPQTEEKTHQGPQERVRAEESAPEVPNGKEQISVVTLANYDAVVTRLEGEISRQEERHARRVDALEKKVELAESREEKLKSELYIEKQRHVEEIAVIRQESNKEVRKFGLVVVLVCLVSMASVAAIAGFVLTRASRPIGPVGEGADSPPVKQPASLPTHDPATATTPTIPVISPVENAPPAPLAPQTPSASTTSPAVK